MKRGGPLKPMSDKRREQIPARRACVEAVIARDGGCVFGRTVERTWPRIDFTTGPFMNCSGSLTAHEPGKRSHGADPTNPDECVTLCAHHHDYVHGHPRASEALGLLIGSETRLH